MHHCCCSPPLPAAQGRGCHGSAALVSAVSACNGPASQHVDICIPLSYACVAAMPLLHPPPHLGVSHSSTGLQQLSLVGVPAWTQHGFEHPIN